MGIFDHRKQWDFETTADPGACLVAFREALTSRTIGDTFRIAGRWAVVQESPTASRAIYKGRGGLIGGLTPTVNLARQEQAAARGSELTFRVSERAHSGARTSCSMWLSYAAIIRVAFIPFTADARFIRGSMHRVVHRLRTVDPGLVLVRH